MVELVGAFVDEDRPTLKLIVEDSGRTWLVEYDGIRRIPPETLQLGDVLIVSNPPDPGVMFMQATRRNGTAWKIEAVTLG